MANFSPANRAKILLRLHDELLASAPNMKLRAKSLSFYHLLFFRNLCFDRTDLWFRSNELSIETTSDQTDLIPTRRIGK